MARRSRIVALVLSALVLFATACGGNDDAELKQQISELSRDKAIAQQRIDGLTKRLDAYDTEVAQLITERNKALYQVSGLQAKIVDLTKKTMSISGVALLDGVPVAKDIPLVARDRTYGDCGRTLITDNGRYQLEISVSNKCFALRDGSLQFHLLQPNYRSMVAFETVYFVTGELTGVILNFTTVEPGDAELTVNDIIALLAANLDSESGLIKALSTKVPKAQRVTAGQTLPEDSIFVADTAITVTDKCLYAYNRFWQDAEQPARLFWNYCPAPRSYAHAPTDGFVVRAAGFPSCGQLYKVIQRGGC